MEATGIAMNSAAPQDGYRDMESAVSADILANGLIAGRKEKARTGNPQYGPKVYARVREVDRRTSRYL